MSIVAGMSKSEVVDYLPQLVGILRGIGVIIRLGERGVCFGERERTVYISFIVCVLSFVFVVAQKSLFIFR